MVTYLLRSSSSSPEFLATRATAGRTYPFTTKNIQKPEAGGPKPVAGSPKPVAGGW